MSVDDGLIGVAVYLPRDSSLESMEIFEKAGIEISETHDDVWTGTWKSLDFPVELRLIEQEYNRLLWIQFSERSFVRLRPEYREPLQQSSDGGMAIVAALRELCEALEPEVAMFLSHTWQDLDWLDEHDWLVLSSDAKGLLGLGAGALYLNDDLAAQIEDPGRQLAGRDRIEIARGMLVLAGADWARFS